MGSSTGARMWWGIAVAVAAAIAILIVGASADAIAIAAVGGIAAALVANDRTGLPPPSPPPAPPTETTSLDPLLDALAEPVLVVTGGRVSRANAAARRLLGAHIVGEDARVAIRHPAAAARLAENGDEEPVDLVGLGGIDQPWSMRVVATGEGERIVQLIDRSQGHAAERMRVDFVANASHELRTPLAAILGYVETLRDDDEASAATRDRFLGIVDDEARRMQRLIDDLISLSRIEADRYRLPVTVIDLGRLLGEVAAEFNSPRAADLIVTPGPAAVAVAGDRIQLSQLLHNLIGNALKYGRPGTPVLAGIDQGGAEVTLTVADQGDGIAAAHLPRLTERFYRVDAGRSRSLGGTGLGLAIVKHIVERHRGRMAIASTVGVGTTVTVVLPAADAAVIKA